ncbi:COX15/CtaA family protein [Luteococcus sanguinis]|uniref:Heme A synthase n=1 Tax=Luteococcus sanguinis TaxID=174038 RepID=A0ABW1WWM8_9ACTN
MSAPSRQPEDPASQVLRVRRLVWANLVGNILIIVTGVLVRVTGSGLGCPTWPTCVPGSVVPVAGQAQGFHKFIEFGNRMLTPVLVVIAAALYLTARSAYRSTRPKFVRDCVVPLVFVLVQGVVGGVIVLTHLDPATVSPHFLISIFLVANATYLLIREREGDGPAQPTVPPLVATLAKVGTAVGTVVIILGTAVTGSGPHSGDAAATVRYGFDPRATSWLHADSVMLFIGLLVALLVASRLVDAPKLFRTAWQWAAGISVAEGVLGYTQYFTGRPMGLVLIHVLLAALLTVAVTVGLVTTRRREPLS